MTIKYYSLLILLFIININILHAQNITQTVRGKILDQQSGFPIIGANVIIMASDPILGSTSNELGEFKIEKVPVGRHNLKVSFIGYEDTTLPELLVSSGKEVVMNIELRESLITLEEIEINASEQEKGTPINDMTLISAQSFSVEETTRYAATFDDPARAVLSMPGVTGGGDDVSNEIVIRGNSPRGVLWRVEGVEVPNPNHFAEEGSSAGAISMLSNNMLSNSDFLTGAFPAEYGNALSGVFDINLRQGNNEKKEYAFEAGLLGIAFAAEGPFTENGKSSYLLNYRYSTISLIDKIGVEIIEPNEVVTFQDFSFKFHFPTKKAGAFTFWGLGGASDFDHIADTTQFDFIDELSGNKMLATGLTHVFYLNQNTYIKSILSWSGLKNQFHGDSLGQKIIWEEDYAHATLRTSILLNQKLNARNTLRSGFVVNHLGFALGSKYRPFPGAELITDLDASGNTQFYQIYSQWQHRLNEKLLVNTGLHTSYFSLNRHKTLEPRLSFRWQFKPNQALSGGFGLHSRLEPISLYLAKEQVSDNETVQPNKTLALTKALHYVLGYENKLRPDMKLKMELYYQHLFDVPIRPANVTVPWERSESAINARDGYTRDTLVNEGTGRNYGLELTLEKYFTNNYYFMITGSLFESKYTAADGIERNTRFNANFVANATIGKEFKVGKKRNNLIGINGRIIWSGGQRDLTIDLEASREINRTVYNWDRIYDTRLANYFRMDLGIRYIKNKPNHSSIIALNIQNFTGKYNVYDQYYSPFTKNIETSEQLGLFPNLSYRIEF